MVGYYRNYLYEDVTQDVGLVGCHGSSHDYLSWMDRIIETVIFIVCKIVFSGFNNEGRKGR